MTMIMGERKSASSSLLLLLCVLLCNHYTQLESVAGLEPNANITSNNDNTTTTAAFTTTMEPSSVAVDTGNSSAPISINDCNGTSNATTMCSNSSTTDLTKPGSKSKGKTFFNTIMDKDNQKIYMRAFYVVIGVSGLVIIYLGVKMYRTRKNKRKTKHYGVLNDRQLELGNVDDEEEDDLFDQSRRRLL